MWLNKIWEMDGKKRKSNQIIMKLSRKRSLALSERGDDLQSTIFSKNLLSYRARAGLTQREVAEKLGVRQQTIAAWEAKRSSPPPDVIRKLAEVFAITTDELLVYPEVCKDSWPKRKLCIPVVRTMRKDDLYEESEIVSREFIYSEYGCEYIGLIMQDESMAPKICNGDLLIVEKTQQATSGSIVVFADQDGTNYIRKYICLQESAILLPFSHDYAVQHIDENLFLQMLGKVTCTHRNW